MPKRDPENRVPAAARAFAALQGEDATTAGGGPSVQRRFGATVLALLVLAAFPLYLAASSTGLLGDAPTALAKGPNSGPGSSGGDDDDDSSGPGPAGDDDARAADDDDDTGTHTRTGARGATDDTSRPGASTRGTTRDNDTRTNSNTHTRTRGQTQTRTQGQTQTRTGS